MAFAMDPEKKGEILWQYRAGQGGVLGGIEWGAATDAERAYFAVSDITTAAAWRSARGESGDRHARVVHASAHAGLRNRDEGATGRSRRP